MQGLENWPLYDIDSASLKKFRRRAQDGLRALERDERIQYANAVEQAVLAKHRSFLKGHSEPNAKPNCVSGTWHSDGESISAAIRAQQRAALAAAPAQIRKKRTAKEWQELYDAAMKAKKEST